MREALVHYYDTHRKDALTMCGRQSRTVTLWDGRDHPVVTCRQCVAAINDRRRHIGRRFESQNERKLWRSVLGE